MYQTEEVLINKIYPVGNSGIYINPNQLQNAVSNWVENTPGHIKINQFATITLILSVVTLIVSSIFE